MYRQLAFGSLGLVALVVILYTGGQDALDSLASSIPGYLAMAFVTTVCVTVVSAWRWAILTDRLMGEKVCSFLVYYRSYILARAAGIFVPQGASDFALRPVLHRISSRSGITNALTGVAFERVADVSLIPAVAIPATLFLTGAVDATVLWWFYLAALALWAVLFVTLGPTLVRSSAAVVAAATRVLQMGGLWLAPANRATKIMSESMVRVAEQRTVLGQVAALSLLRYVLIGLQFLLVAYALDLDGIGAVEMAAALPSAQLGAMFAITPAGLGFVEGGFFGALQLMEVATGSITAFLVGQRVLVSLFTLVPAMLFLAPGPWRGALSSRRGIGPAKAELGE
jgi:uncharacterized protein (TIRG00374 family)